MDSENTSSDGEEDPWKGVKHELHKLVSRVESTGSFATFGRVPDFVLPGVSVDSDHVLRLPLSQEDAQILVQHGRQAPFGSRTETIVDTSVRNTREIDADRVRFHNKLWQGCLDRVVEKVARELGSREVRIEFYKMLIYAEGGMFKAHRDTEKVPGMFATLVICLPSEHSGGAVCLQHGAKRQRLETSEHSKLDATYMAWYTDVVHEIEPVESGYRWVLVYNLISTAADTTLSATLVDAQVRNLKEVLTQWQNLSKPFQFLALPLEHQYTSSGLRLAQLKGADYHRANYLIQGCAEHGGFNVLFANMELKVTDLNAEDEAIEKEEHLYLTYIAGTNGLDLTLARLSIQDTQVLGGPLGDRVPDFQHGGEWLGNQHAEIDQFFNNSVLIVCTRSRLRPFLLGGHGTQSALELLVSTILKHPQEDGEDPLLHQLFQQTCQHTFSTEHADKDGHLGAIAAIAVFKQDSPLFKKAVQHTTSHFQQKAYSTIGELICLRQPVVPEEDIITALIKSQELHLVYEAIVAFQRGHAEGHPERDDHNHLQNWLDKVLTDFLAEAQTFYSADARTLVKMILDRGTDNPRQSIIYESVIAFVDRFIHDKLLPTILMVELIVELPNSGNSQVYLDNLLRHITEKTASEFDLSCYLDHIEARFYQKFSEQQSRMRVKPLKAFYERIGPREQDVLLGRIQTQAPTLNDMQLVLFLLPFLEDMTAAVDTSSSKVQEFFQLCVEIYIMGKVGKEPRCPSDWARPEELQPTPDWKKCNCATQLNEFLMDPKTKSFAISCGSKEDSCTRSKIWLRFRYDHFWEVERVDDATITITKTMKGWERGHSNWKSRVDDAQAALRKLPQDKLKECLVDKYDELTDLRIVRADDDSICPEDASDRPMKRTKHAA